MHTCILGKLLCSIGSLSQHRQDPKIIPMLVPSIETIFQTHRDEMLQNFMKDQSWIWIGTLHSRNENEVTSGSKAETEDLNKWQVASQSSS